MKDFSASSAIACRVTSHTEHSCIYVHAKELSLLDNRSRNIGNVSAEVKFSVMMYSLSEPTLHIYRSTAPN